MMTDSKLSSEKDADNCLFLIKIYFRISVRIWPILYKLYIFLCILQKTKTDEKQKQAKNKNRPKKNRQKEEDSLGKFWETTKNTSNHLTKI